jgi:transcriptional regulator with XRE-family HTH domain
MTINDETRDVHSRPPSLASRVRAIRERQELSQEAVAARAGLRQTDISRIERGIRANIGLDTARKLARGLGCTLAELAGE